jgi:hypothetical protein
MNNANATTSEISLFKRLPDFCFSADVMRATFDVDTMADGVWSAILEDATDDERADVIWSREELGQRADISTVSKVPYASLSVEASTDGETAVERSRPRKNN